MLPLGIIFEKCRKNFHLFALFIFPGATLLTYWANAKAKTFQNSSTPTLQISSLR
jgi:hypothetical protein